MDSECVNKINLYFNKLCQKKKKIIKENKDLKKHIKYYKNLEKSNPDFIFFLNGENARTVHIDEKRGFFVMVIPVTNSQTKIFSEFVLHIKEELGDIRVFEDFAKALNVTDIENSLGIGTIDSYEEPIRTFFSNYDSETSFLDENPECVITLTDSDGNIFHNISELSDIKYDEKDDSVLFGFKSNGRIRIPDDGRIYNRVLIETEYFDLKKKDNDLFINA